MFGSFANGLSTWNSDLDLVVTGIYEPDRMTGGESGRFREGAPRVGGGPGSREKDWPTGGGLGKGGAERLAGMGLGAG